MSGGALGAVPLWSALVWPAGPGVFTVACELSATEPRGSRLARRIVARRRVSPHVPVACSSPAAVGGTLLVVYPR